MHLINSTRRISLSFHNYTSSSVLYFIILCFAFFRIIGVCLKLTRNLNSGILLVDVLLVVFEFQSDQRLWQTDVDLVQIKEMSLKQ